MESERCADDDTKALPRNQICELESLVPLLKRFNHDGFQRRTVCNVKRGAKVSACHASRRIRSGNNQRTNDTILPGHSEACFIEAARYIVGPLSLIELEAMTLHLFQETNIRTVRF